MVNKNALAYAAATFGSSLINSIFGFFYVKTFLNIYKINGWWFNTAQIIYMIWNAVNDPLFGYLQDSSNIKIFRVRSLAVLVGAPLYALSFLTPWFPLISERPEWMVGLHLLFSLCFFDSLFTFVLLAHCALFTEISPSANDRAQLLKYSQIASIMGSSAVFVADYVSDSQKNFVNFQILCVIVAIISCVAMCYAGLNVKVDKKYEPVIDEKGDKKNGPTSVSWWSLTFQICKQKNFVCFVIMNFLQIFHTTYSSNFFLIFAEELMGSQLPPFVRSLLAGSTFMIPQILGLLANPLIVKYGSYHIILSSFYIKLVMAVLLYLSGPNQILILAAFFVLDKSIPSATFSQFNIPLSDIIDDDLAKHKRSSPISSLVFGTNALFTKPAQSFAPMLIVAILSSYGYDDKSHTMKPTTSPGSLSSSADLKTVMFNVMCFLPAIIAILQILVWNSYTLRGRRDKTPEDERFDLQ
ncbi:transmembrane protein 180-like isoform X1 [Dendronephthya gigantea]|uniref:transmembrane protein 180-like isoform X1 n=1 Tax=Dendronephthya gigantea TaxID=151771 RepID=UPI00106ADB2D|nr:transmembrane protein 180-like isoform X1 [Dendronephthya gigantea]